jgi:hypothetical protein
MRLRARSGQLVPRRVLAAADRPAKWGLIVAFGGAARPATADAPTALHQYHLTTTTPMPGLRMRRLVAALRSAAGLMVARIGTGGEELTRTLLLVR